MVMSFCAVLFFPRGVLDEILNLIESVSEDFSLLLMYRTQPIRYEPIERTA